MNYKKFQLGQIKFHTLTTADMLFFIYKGAVAAPTKKKTPDTPKR